MNLAFLTKSMSSIMSQEEDLVRIVLTWHAFGWGEMSSSCFRGTGILERSETGILFSSRILHC